LLLPQALNVFTTAADAHRRNFTMTETITARYRWTADELVRAQRWHLRRRTPRYRGVVIWVLMVGFSFADIRAFAVGDIGTGYEMIGIPVFLLIYVVLIALNPWLSRRQYRKRPDVDCEVEYIVSPDGFRTRTDLGTNEHTWALLTEVVKTPEGYLYYWLPQVFYWLPRHAFASDDDFAAFGALAQAYARKFTCIS
jgi:hypothetical protein